MANFASKKFGPEGSLSSSPQISFPPGLRLWESEFTSKQE